MTAKVQFRPKTAIEHDQKVSEPHLKCEKMDIVDSSKADALTTEFDANLTVLRVTSTLVVNRI